MVRRALHGCLASFLLLACGSADDTGASGIGSTDNRAPTTSESASQGTTTDSPAAFVPGAAREEALGAPYPILLMHGMGGFRELDIQGLSMEYFNGVRDDLQALGEDVYTTEVSAFDTSEVRAAALATQIDAILKQTNKKKVNLVGHSQGGIDARVLASPNGMGYGDRIASVTTVATPHQGSGVADFLLGITNVLPEGMVDTVASKFLSLIQKTAYDLKSDTNLRAQATELTEKFMVEQFNPKYIDDPGVTYESYAGRTNNQSGKGVCDNAVLANNPQAKDSAQAPLFPLAVYLEQGKGRANDGLVTVESSKWGTFVGCVPADHLKEVGMINLEGKTLSGFDHKEFFRGIVKRIRQNGF